MAGYRFYCPWKSPVLQQYCWSSRYKNDVLRFITSHSGKKVSAYGCERTPQGLVGSIFLIADIFHSPLSDTRTNVLHILRIELFGFCISYLQSTIAAPWPTDRSFSMVRVLVPGEFAELFSIPRTDAAMPFLHSPVETNWSTSSVRMFFSIKVSRVSRAKEYCWITLWIAFISLSGNILFCACNVRLATALNIDISKMVLIVFISGVWCSPFCEMVAELIVLLCNLVQKSSLLH